jgi:hypothetical protein
MNDGPSAKSTMTVLIQSCDRYSDLWKPFYHFFYQNWPDNPFPVYHLSETRKLSDKQVIDISGGINKTWSELLIIALKQIQSEYVLLLLEDYFLIRKVDNLDFYHLLEIAKKESPAFIRIFPVPGPDVDHPHYTDIGIIDKRSPYSISTQATIWNREVLLNFLVPQESAWDLEVKGSGRASEITAPFLSLKDKHGRGKAEEADYPYTYFCTAVYKGKWMRGAVELCKKEGVEIDLKYRRVENFLDVIHRKYYQHFPGFLRHILDFLRARFSK